MTYCDPPPWFFYGVFALVFLTLGFSMVPKMLKSGIEAWDDLLNFWKDRREQ